MAMDMVNWSRSSGTRTIHLGRPGRGRGWAVLAADMAADDARGARQPTWKLLWRKVFKDKRKMMIEYPDHDHSVHSKGGPKYDEYTYSQNFDQGLMWDEIENFSRSFSVRFADPNRIFLKKGDM